MTHDDLVGYSACLVAVLLFGSNFVPVKRVATADGMFFSLIMTSAVFLEGCVVQLWRGSPKFEPFAMLGGVIWCVSRAHATPLRGDTPFVHAIARGAPEGDSPRPLTREKPWRASVFRNNDVPLFEFSSRQLSLKNSVKGTAPLLVRRTV
jgi:hypothetical protein